MLPTGQGNDFFAGFFAGLRRQKGTLIVDKGMLIKVGSRQSAVSQMSV